MFLFMKFKRKIHCVRKCACERALDLAFQSPNVGRVSTPLAPKMRSEQDLTFLAFVGRDKDELLRSVTYDAFTRKEKSPRIHLLT
jgi:hypothetical protein